MADDEVIIIDSEDDGEDPCEAAAGSNPSSGAVNNTHPASSPTSGPSSGRSPLLQQHEVTRGSRDSAARQLYKEGFCRDLAAEAERREYLRKTGKAPVVEQPVKAEEDEDREVTAEDMVALQDELIYNSRLERLLSGGEGSSNPTSKLKWQMRVYQALKQQQEELLREASQQQQRQRQQEQLLRQATQQQDENWAEFEIADSQGEEEEEQDAPPAKKRRTTPQPASAAAAGAGSSKQAAGGAGSSKQPAKRQPQQQRPAEPSEPSSSGAPNNNSEQPSQRPRKPPAPRPPRQQFQQQEQQRKRPSGCGSAAAGGESSGGGGSGTNSFSEREANRALRAKLNKLEQTAISKRDIMINSETGKLVGALCELAELGQLAKRPREAAQHAGVMATCFRSGVEMMHTYSSKRRGRDPSTLTTAVRSLFAVDRAAALSSDSPVAINWEAVGAASQHLFRTVPGVSSMQGAIQAQAKARKQVVRRQKAAVEPEVRPIAGPAALQQDHGLGQETEKVVEDMRRVLQGAGSCSFIQLVLDHDSFAHTLENVFALSFLCKEMFVGLEDDTVKGLTVVHISRERRAQLQRQHDAAAAAGASSGRLVPHQFMMEIDMDCWKDMKHVVPRAETLMPQRPRAHH